ncbi:MAG: hypothetical protein BWY66_01112 [bacterium ADurb.Bin374]|nr:MAG: hypothetical protein BWY66_01112 [bacterium ADurb.Bin374]
MITIREGGLTFDFPDTWTASSFDRWSYYINQFSKTGGQGRQGVKAVDILALDPDRTAWFIEVKDYRRHRRTKPIDLADEVSKKVFDTLAALLPAGIWAAEEEEKRTARDMLKARGLRVVLHLEQPRHPSKLFPRSFDPSVVLMKLRHHLKAIDPHPIVMDTDRQGPVKWRVS